jgi:hypothetical protein
MPTTFIGEVLFMLGLGTKVWTIQHISQSSQKQLEYKQNKLLVHSFIIICTIYRKYTYILPCNIHKKLKTKSFMTPKLNVVMEHLNIYGKRLMCLSSPLQYSQETKN